MFFFKILFKMLELIIGEIMAGNTALKIRKMGVSILDTHLEEPQL